MTKRLSDAQKKVLQHLVDGAYISHRWSRYALNSGTGKYINLVLEATVKALAPYLKSSIHLYHGFERVEVQIINDAGIELATELGYIVDDEAPVDDSNVMDKSIADVLEAAPRVITSIEYMVMLDRYVLIYASLTDVEMIECTSKRYAAIAQMVSSWHMRYSNNRDGDLVAKIYAPVVMADAPSTEPGDYDLPDVDDDILKPGDNVELLMLFSLWRGAVIGTITEHDLDYDLPYKVVYVIDGKWDYQWYAAHEIVKIHEPVVQVKCTSAA